MPNHNDPRLHWLVQPDQQDRLTALAIETALDRLGVRWTEWSPPRGVPDLPDPPTLRPEDLIVCYGPRFVPRVVDLGRWSPGIFFDRDIFRWSVFAHHWSGLMLSPGASVTTVGGILAGEVAVEGSVFIRPDADLKAFDGGVYDRISLARALVSVPTDTPAIVAPVVAIEAEWRVFIAAGDVAGASEYRRKGRASIEGFVPNAVIDLALEADARWRPADVYCLDVAHSAGRFAIVEANCFAAARFYAADVERIVAAVCAAVSRQGIASRAFREPPPSD